jgi:hypothetical protein
MKQIDWKNHIIEFITVVIGISLAFALNSHSENLKEKRDSKEYLLGIKSEISTNLIEIDTALAYHKELLNKMFNDPSSAKLLIKPAHCKNHAWNIAENNTFKKHTDYDLYRDFVEIYQEQEVLKEHNKNAAELMSYINVILPHQILGVDENILNSEEYLVYFVQSWIPIFEDMIYYEEQLQKKYKEILLKL